MYATSVFLFSTTVALAMYAFAGVRFAELVFDYSFGLVAIGLALSGTLLGLAAARRLKQEASSMPWLWSAIIAMPVAAWLSIGLVYGPVWIFLLWSLTFSLPYFLSGIVIARIKAQQGTMNLGKVAVAVGIVTGLFLAYWAISVFQGLWAVQMIAAGLLAVSVPLVSIQRRLFSTVVAIWVAGGLAMLINSPTNQRLAHWSAQHNTLTKPIAMALTEGNVLHSQATRWVPWGRIDQMVANRSVKEGFGWLVTNGTAPVPEAFDEAGKDLVWWKRHFPLLLYPLLVADPEIMLAVGPARGPESAMAVKLGVPAVQEMTYSANPWKGQHGCCGGSTLEPLRELEASGNRVDLVTLSIPHAVSGVWAGVNAQDESMLTSEVLQRYRERLTDDGVLAITAREESLFAKALVSAWMLLLSGPEQDVSGLDKQIRVFRLSQAAPFKGSYRYLILVAKAAFNDDQLLKIKQLLSETQVDPLIYASTVTEPPYRIFQSHGSVTLKRVAQNFAGYFSWKFHNDVNLGPSSIWKSGFFRLSNELHPFLRGLLNICLVVIIYVLLFSNPGLRSGPETRNPVGPSLAVLHFSVLLASLAASLLVILPMYFAGTSLGLSQGTLLLLWSAGVVAAVAGWMVGKNVGGSTILFLLLVLGFWGYLKHSDVDILGSGLLSGILVLVAGLSGLIGAGLHRRSLHILGRAYPEASSWGWALSACAVMAGVLLFIRTWSREGLDTVLAMVAIAYTAVFLISLWSRRGLRHAQVVSEN